MAVTGVLQSGDELSPMRDCVIASLGREHHDKSVKVERSEHVWGMRHLCWGEWTSLHSTVGVE